MQEVLVNAVFHKSYRDDVPVNVRIYTDRIEVINYPGPDRWIDMEKFAAGQIRSRKYRNRRIGEMFKEIDLSEKQGTGITKILRTLKANGSPAPGFETVDERVYLSTVIRMHEGFGVVDSQSDPQNDPQKVSQNDLQKKQSFTRMEEAIIQVIQAEPTITRSEIAEKLGVSLKTVARRLKGMTNVQYVGSSKSGHWEID